MGSDRLQTFVNKFSDASNETVARYLEKALASAFRSEDSARLSSVGDDSSIKMRWRSSVMKRPIEKLLSLRLHMSGGKYI